MAEAFFHHKPAVFHYFQLAIEILARTHSGKSLWRKVGCQSIATHRLASGKCHFIGWCN